MNNAALCIANWELRQNSTRDTFLDFASSVGIGMFFGERTFRSREFPMTVFCTSERHQEYILNDWLRPPSADTIELVRPQKITQEYSTKVAFAKNEMEVLLLDESEYATRWISYADAFIKTTAKEFLSAVQHPGKLQDFLNHTAFQISNLGKLIRFEGDSMNPRMNIVDSSYVFLGTPLPFWEDDLAIKAFLLPYMNGEAASWSRIRRCEMCGRYFFYKLERAKFCSTNCRVRSANQKRGIPIKK